MKTKKPSATEELVSLVEHWKKEARGFQHQMEVNNDYATCYENALRTIARMLGWKPNMEPNCTAKTFHGDIDSIAINLVKEKLEGRSKKS